MAREKGGRPNSPDRIPSGADKAQTGSTYWLKSTKEKLFDHGSLEEPEERPEIPGEESLKPAKPEIDHLLRARIHNAIRSAAWFYGAYPKAHYDIIGRADKAFA